MSSFWDGLFLFGNVSHFHPTTNLPLTWGHPQMTHTHTQTGYSSECNQSLAVHCLMLPCPAANMNCVVYWQWMWARCVCYIGFTYPQGCNSVVLCKQDSPLLVYSLLLIQPYSKAMVALVSSIFYCCMLWSSILLYCKPHQFELHLRQTIW